MRRCLPDTPDFRSASGKCPALVWTEDEPSTSGDLPVGENYMQQPASGVAHATTPEKGGGQSIKLLPDGLNGSIVPTNFSYGMPAFGRQRQFAVEFPANVGIGQVTTPNRRSRMCAIRSASDKTPGTRPKISWTRKN
jgi:hypothetical protein